MFRKPRGGRVENKVDRAVVAAATFNLGGWRRIYLSIAPATAGKLWSGPIHHAYFKI
jgi:hypothetical protein